MVASNCGKMNTPDISVLIPIYNTKESELRLSIESILNQTFKNYELILINDGSTNNVEDVILSYSDDRIRYLKNEKNIRLIDTLNRGISISKGKYIARLDADDFCTPDRLEKQWNFMEAHPNIGLTGTFFVFVPANHPRVLPSTPEEVKCYVRYIPGNILHSSAMMKKSVLVDNNLRYNKNCLHAEDFKLWSDISRVADVMIIPEFLTFYRTSEDGICANNKYHQRKMLMMIIFDNIIQDYPCDKEEMCHALYNFVQDTAIPLDIYKKIEKLLHDVANDLENRISYPFNQVVRNSVLPILKYMKVSSS